MTRHEMNRRDSLLAKANYLRLVAADLADSMRSGAISSLYKGQGMEFAGVREYIRGDDVRAIDWNVTARMNRPYIKQFEESRELQIFTILDASASMRIRTKKTTKFDLAAEAGAILTLAAELNACPAGAAIFDGQIYFSCRPRLGGTQTMRIITEMDRLPARQANGSVLASAIAGAGKLLRSRSLICIFSDFRAADWEKPIISLAQKNQVIAFRLSSPDDLRLPSLGNAVFKDAESGREVELPSSSGEFQRKFRDYNQARQIKWKNFCLAHRIQPVFFDVSDEPLEILQQAFKIGARRTGAK